MGLLELVILVLLLCWLAGLLVPFGGAVVNVLLVVVIVLLLVRGRDTRL